MGNEDAPRHVTALHFKCGGIDNELDETLDDPEPVIVRCFEDGSLVPSCRYFNCKDADCTSSDDGEDASSRARCPYFAVPRSS